MKIMIVEKNPEPVNPINSVANSGPEYKYSFSRINRKAGIEVEVGIGINTRGDDPMYVEQDNNDARYQPTMVRDIGFST